MALKEAEAAQREGEIPIGAVIVCRDRIIARAHNLTETLTDVTAHAEMQAITAAGRKSGAWSMAHPTRNAVSSALHPRLCIRDAR